MTRLPAIMMVDMNQESRTTSISLVRTALSITRKYFIIVLALFGNGESTSPSNIPTLDPFLEFTLYDNVRAQHALLTEKLNVKRALCVLGWSMGACQAYQWITQYPDFVDVAVPFCGAAETSVHTQVALDGLRGFLQSAEAEMGTQKYETHGHGEAEGRSDQGVRTSNGRVGLWKKFYDEKLFHSEMGFESSEDSLCRFWEA
jgi:pimeloyl-ACP methyl ester carboxylesterase